MLDSIKVESLSKTSNSKDDEYNNIFNYNINQDNNKINKNNKKKDYNNKNNNNNIENNEKQTNKKKASNFTLKSLYNKNNKTKSNSTLMFPSYCNNQNDQLDFNFTKNHFKSEVNKKYEESKDCKSIYIEPEVNLYKKVKSWVSNFFQKFRFDLGLKKDQTSSEEISNNNGYCVNREINYLNNNNINCINRNSHMVVTNSETEKMSNTF